jgi:phosphate transport system permease protein
MVLLSGTITSSAVALLVAVPLGTTIAIYLSEFATPRAREIAKPILELLAGVPSVVYGFIGMEVLVPFIRNAPLLGGPGYSALAASIILAYCRRKGRS